MAYSLLKEQVERLSFSLPCAEGKATSAPQLQTIASVPSVYEAEGLLKNKILTRQSLSPLSLATFYSIPLHKGAYR